jgi:hypothetical protein
VKTPVGLRPAALGARPRLLAAALALVVVAGVALWWVVGADSRRAAQACDLYEDQQEALETVVVEVGEAVERAGAADGGTVIGYVDDIDRELGSLRRWQSTTPRLERALGDDVDGDVGSTLTAVTGAVAQMQRLVESGSPEENLAWTGELATRLETADARCAEV